MKNSRALIFFLVIIANSALEARQFPDSKLVVIKVHDSNGLELDDVEFSFEGTPVELKSYENGAYTLNVPISVTKITIDRIGYPATSIDVSGLISAEDLLSFVVTLEASPNQNFPVKILNYH